MSNLIKDVSNINYLNKLKDKIYMDTNKISYVPNICKGDLFYEVPDSNYYKMYMIIITKKLKKFKKFFIVPATLNNNKMKRRINNLVIDHISLSFYFRYFIEYCGINPIMQLMMLVHLLKFLNIKKITLHIVLNNYIFLAQSPVLEFLRNILQKYCKDMHIIINYDSTQTRFLTHFHNCFNTSNEKCIIINKTESNHHRNFKLKNRTK